MAKKCFTLPYAFLFYVHPVKEMYVALVKATKRHRHFSLWTTQRDIFFVITESSSSCSAVCSGTNEGTELRQRTLATTVGKSDVLHRYFHNVSNFFNRKPAATGVGGRVGFPTINFPKERVFILFRVNPISSILFILLSEAE